MAQFDVSEHYVHPAGTYPATLVDWEERDGQYGPRIRWQYELMGQERPDGQPVRLSYFTSVKFSAKTKLGGMVAALAVTLPRTKEEAARFNADALIGKVCRLQVVHAVRDEETWSDVAAVLPMRARADVAPQPAAAPATATPAEPEDEDPFAEETAKAAA